MKEKTNRIKNPISTAVALLLLCTALLSVAAFRTSAVAADEEKTFVDLGGIVTDYDAVETEPVAIANASFEDALLSDDYGNSATGNWRNIWGASSSDWKAVGDKSLKITYEWTGITTSTFPTTYQDITVEPYTTYVITFAMLSSRVTDKAFHVAVRNPSEWNNIYDYSVNANDIEAKQFTYYRCSVYSGHRTTLRLCFWCQGNAGTTNFGGFYVDDVTVSKVIDDNETMQDFSSMFTLAEDNLVKNNSFEDGEVNQVAPEWTRIGWSETFEGNATEGTKSLKICYSFDNQLNPAITVGSYQDIAVEKNSTYVLTFTAELDNSARNDLHIGYGGDDALTAPRKDYVLDGAKISVKFTTSNHTVYQTIINSGDLETIRLYFKTQGQESSNYCAFYIDNVQLYKVESVTDTGILASCGTENHHIYDGLDHAAAECGTAGHYNCDGNHALAACGEHYVCAGGSHELLACGEHYACEGGEHGLANCGTHYVCDGNDHSDAACGTDGHYVCDTLDHAAAGCGTTGHYNCDGLDHTAAECGTAGHYNCDGDHALAACGEHYVCAGGSHELLACGEHYACEEGEHGLANCGTHYVCDGNDHSDAACGTDGHYVCDTLDHAAAGCGTDGHYNCDGLDHAAAGCGTDGHYNCDGLDHAAAECGTTGHYNCDGADHTGENAGNGGCGCNSSVGGVGASGFAIVLLLGCALTVFFKRNKKSI